MFHLISITLKITLFRQKRTELFFELGWDIEFKCDDLYYASKIGKGGHVCSHVFLICKDVSIFQ